MTTKPGCKINLGLHVVGRRPDGYHDLQTIFLPVSQLHDELTITPLPDSEPATLTQDGLELDNAPADNICLRAYHLLQAEFSLPPVSITLHKHIPFGAGLGGGSSDAAATLGMLNTMFSLGLDATALEQRAAHLGADCAFFVRNQPAYATGIGDRLEPLPELSTLGNQYSIQIAIPDGEHVSTREAYSGLDHSLFGTERPDLRLAVRQPVAEWRKLIANDFERSVFRTHPAIAELKDDMYRHGALYASMTGSGAAVFGLFPR